MKMSIEEYRREMGQESPKTSKYGNKPTQYDGILYMSKKEADYAQSLDLAKWAKQPNLRVISVERQVPYPLVVNGANCGKYLADFRVKYADGHIEVIDVKGFRTAIYRLKKKIVEAIYKIEIIEK